MASARLDDRAAAHVVTVVAAQLGGPWLDLDARLARLVAATSQAADAGADLVVFPEAYLSGYPFWMMRTESGTRFDDPDQKACYAYYLDSALTVGGPETRTLAALAGDLGVTLMVGVSERPERAGRGSAYCTLLTVAPGAGVVGVHRKLVPTFDERLVWAPGDAAGLRTHDVAGVQVGGLSCWENWMPQARQVLYADGELVHVSTWPGSPALTRDITRFAAIEGRQFHVAVGGVLGAGDIPDDFPLAAELRANAAPTTFTGGSAVAGPDGAWLVEPVEGEGLVVVDLDLRRVGQERLTFDPTGHYSRPDVLVTQVDRRRRGAVSEL
ncbi:carbon-nitrogen hydrolase family protein [Nocardioides mangrovicus]|uniref:carbon-nitrogen hydrolase family protein n=1 Tax=Nocardioides mangrovicus TaxID=2478913 RepID=UPI0018E0B9B3|nr:carbon-nitrogen hydrolase family protein [Nocardioides mangrovicus]